MNHTNLYAVHVGLIEKSGVRIDNWSRKNVLAADAKAAISKARLRKNQYAESVELVAKDVLT